MSRDTLPPDCPRTDAVLAIYLDGDADGGDPAAGAVADGGIAGSGFEFVCGESLRDHLLGCATCRTQLLRARRLDALLAAQAGRTVDGAELDGLAARWCAALEPTAATPRRPALARAVAAVVLLLLPLGVGAVWWLGGGGGPHTPSGPTPPAAPPSAAIAPAPAAPAPPARGDILIALDAPQRRARQPRADVTPRAAATADLPRVLADAALPTTERLAALERLVAAVGSRRGEAAEPGARWLEILAGCGDQDADQRAFHRRALDLLRGAPHLLGQLQADLQSLDSRRSSPTRGDVAVLTVAARLGERALDAAIQRAVRRHPELATPLAAALRCDVRDTGGAALLLDVWQDLTARGELADDETRPCAWFAQQPAAVMAELERLLRATRSAPRRVQCLLALGQGTDDHSLEVLLEHTQRAPFLEAHAAAFALSQRPRWQLETLVARARSDDMYLLRAALARAGVPAATVWVDALALGAAERALLVDGTFPDFPRVANWFRDRTFALGD